MKNAKTVLLGILVSAVALSALVAPASAQFVHTRGILMTVWPQEVVVFWGAPGYYQRNILVVIKPPWYFVEDLMGFDSLTLTYKLVGNCYQCRNQGTWPTLLGQGDSGQVVTSLGPVGMSEEDNGAAIVVPITFVITGTTGRGYYMLFLSAVATVDGATFTGWDQVGVAIAPD